MTTTSSMNCSRCQQQLPLGAAFCPACGASCGAPPTSPTASPSRTDSDATGGLIPYKNPKALWGYYCAIFSLLPIAGLPLGIIAIVLGFLGLRDYRREPHRRGAAHAWIALILGSVTTIGWGTALAMMVTAMMGSM